MIINNKKYNYYLLIYIILFTLLLFITYNVSFANTGTSTGLKIPRFVSLKSNEVNLRVGPSINYPIKLKYTQNNLPIEIIDEFDVWRKVKDYENNIGWLHKSLVKGERNVLIVNKDQVIKNIHNRPNGKIIGGININNILNLERCLIHWCLISHKDIKGWLSKESIWGVYKNEVYNLRFYQPIINQYWKMLDSNFVTKTLNFN